ncbi:hypothetical protein GH714_007384 [Hevea brasiliensis]|uniref:Uncharacterized protein n=1 Tax=Hevea brasiliensis TaxID=3981 RepID=A0A6A6MWJ5_HEVBR|nr:hypothetical protein GH714_007384 [Hevea brasiliensis]
MAVDGVDDLLASLNLTEGVFNMVNGYAQLLINVFRKDVNKGVYQGDLVMEFTCAGIVSNDFTIVAIVVGPQDSPYGLALSLVVNSKHLVDVVVHPQGVDHLQLGTEVELVTLHSGNLLVINYPS